MTKTPTNSQNQPQQIVHQFDNTTAHLSDVTASCPLNTSLSSRDKKSVNPMTFSQKFYQSHALEVAEAFEQALEANTDLKKECDRW